MQLEELEPVSSRQAPNPVTITHTQLFLPWFSGSGTCVRGYTRKHARVHIRTHTHTQNTRTLTHTVDVNGNFSAHIHMLKAHPQGHAEASLTALLHSSIMQF